MGIRLARAGGHAAVAARGKDVGAVGAGVLVAAIALAAAQAGHVIGARAAPQVIVASALPDMSTGPLEAWTSARPHGWDDLPGVVAEPVAPSAVGAPAEVAMAAKAAAPVARSQSYKISAAERARVVAILEAAAAEFGRNTDLFLKVAFCESSFRQYALGRAGEKGVFQFMPRTFEANARRLGYSLADIWDVRAQARVAAEMMSRGQAWQWTCARKVGAP